MPSQPSPDRKLTSSNRYYRLLVECACEFAIISIDESGRIVGWNRGAERILGWREEEVLGQSVAVIFTEEDRQARVPEEDTLPFSSSTPK